MPSQENKIQRFRELHQSNGAFVIPNPWDAGSAKRFQSLGYEALASTSSGFAFTLGRTDMQVTLEEKLEHLKQLCSATTVPINADFEKCFADDPTTVARNITLAYKTGIAGASIEDATTNPNNPIFGFNHAVERVAAAAEAVKQEQFPMLLTARAENFLWGKRDLDDTIKRLQAFEKVGADVLYAPGLRSIEEIETVAAAVTKPINVLGVMIKDTNVQQLEAAGAKRISVGGALARTAIAAELNAARELLDQGIFNWAENAESNSVLEQLMP